MSLIRRGIESRASVNYFGNQYNPFNLLYGQTSVWSSAGERVDEVTALGIASVMSAVSLLADSVATMPIICTETQPDGALTRVPTPDFIDNPDPENTNRYEFIHSVMVSLALHGNAYIKLDKVNGRVVGMLPLHPYQMNVLASKDYNGRQYLWLGQIIPNDLILHIRWMTPPQSLVGVSPLLQQRTMMGLALAMDKYLANWYANGATPGAVLETERSLTTEAARTLRESWEASQRKGRRPAILSDGLKWRNVQTSAVDMEFNLTRDAVLQEVARVFRIPPALLNVKSAAQDYANVEQSSLNFLTYTLQPWITRLEIALSTLLPPGVDLRFDPRSLLRLDASTKAKVELMEIQSGKKSPNELRLADGLEPYDGGDSFFMALPGAPMGADSSPAVGEEQAREAQAITVNVDNSLDGLTKALREAPPPVVPVEVRVDAPVVNVEAPAPAAAPQVRSRRLERDENGNITRIVEES